MTSGRNNFHGDEMSNQHNNESYSADQDYDDYDTDYNASYVESVDFSNPNECDGFHESLQETRAGAHTNPPSIRTSHLHNQHSVSDEHQHGAGRISVNSSSMSNVNRRYSSSNGSRLQVHNNRLLHSIQERNSGALATMASSPNVLSPTASMIGNNSGRILSSKVHTDIVIETSEKTIRIQDWTDGFKDYGKNEESRSEDDYLTKKSHLKPQQPGTVGEIFLFKDVGCSGYLLMTHKHILIYPHKNGINSNPVLMMQRKMQSASSLSSSGSGLALGNSIPDVIIAIENVKSVNRLLGTGTCSLDANSDCFEIVEKNGMCHWFKIDDFNGSHSSSSDGNSHSANGSGKGNMNSLRSSSQTLNPKVGLVGLSHQKYDRTMFVTQSMGESCLRIVKCLRSAVARCQLIIEAVEKEETFSLFKLKVQNFLEGIEEVSVLRSSYEIYDLYGKVKRSLTDACEADPYNGPVNLLSQLPLIESLNEMSSDGAVQEHERSRRFLNQVTEFFHFLLLQSTHSSVSSLMGKFLRPDGLPGAYEFSALANYYQRLQLLQANPITSCSEDGAPIFLPGTQFADERIVFFKYSSTDEYFREENPDDCQDDYEDLCHVDDSIAEEDGYDEDWGLGQRRGVFCKKPQGVGGHYYYSELKGRKLVTVSVAKASGSGSGGVAITGNSCKLSHENPLCIIRVFSVRERPSHHGVMGKQQQSVDGDFKFLAKTTVRGMVRNIKFSPDGAFFSTTVFLGLDPGKDINPSMFASPRHEISGLYSRPVTGKMNIVTWGIWGLFPTASSNPYEPVAVKVFPAIDLVSNDVIVPAKSCYSAFDDRSDLTIRYHQQNTDNNCNISSLTRTPFYLLAMIVDPNSIAIWNVVDKSMIMYNRVDEKIRPENSNPNLKIKSSCASVMDAAILSTNYGNLIQRLSSRSDSLFALSNVTCERNPGFLKCQFHPDANAPILVTSHNVNGITLFNYLENTSICNIRIEGALDFYMEPVVDDYSGGMAAVGRESVRSNNGESSSKKGSSVASAANNPIHNNNYIEDVIASGGFGCNRMLLSQLIPVHITVSSLNRFSNVTKIVTYEFPSRAGGDGGGDKRNSGSDRSSGGNRNSATSLTDSKSSKKKSNLSSSSYSNSVSLSMSQSSSATLPVVSVVDSFEIMEPTIWCDECDANGIPESWQARRNVKIVSTPPKQQRRQQGELRHEQGGSILVVTNHGQVFLTRKKRFQSSMEGPMRIGSLAGLYHESNRLKAFDKYVLCHLGVRRVKGDSLGGGAAGGAGSKSRSFSSSNSVIFPATPMSSVDSPMGFGNFALLSSSHTQDMVAASATRNAEANSGPSILISSSQAAFLNIIHSSSYNPMNPLNSNNGLGGLGGGNVAGLGLVIIPKLIGVRERLQELESSCYFPQMANKEGVSSMAMSSNVVVLAGAVSVSRAGFSSDGMHCWTFSSTERTFRVYNIDGVFIGETLLDEIEILSDWTPYLVNNSPDSVAGGGGGGADNKQHSSQVRYRTLNEEDLSSQDGESPSGGGIERRNVSLLNAGSSNASLLGSPRSSLRSSVMQNSPRLGNSNNNVSFLKQPLAMVGDDLVVYLIDASGRMIMKRLCKTRDSSSSLLCNSNNLNNHIAILEGDHRATEAVGGVGDHRHSAVVGTEVIGSVNAGVKNGPGAGSVNNIGGEGYQSPLHLLLDDHNLITGAISNVIKMFMGSLMNQLISCEMHLKTAQDQNDLFAAIEARDLAGINAVFTRNPLLNPNFQSLHKQAIPLITACRKGFHEIVEILLKRGASISISSSESDQLPIHAVCHSGSIKCLERIAKAPGFRVDVKHHLSVMEAQFLVPHYPAESQTTYLYPLHVAAFHGHDELVRILIDTYGADPNVTDSQGRTALHYACMRYDRHCKIGLIECLLLRAPRTVNSISQLSDSTPLHHLVFNENCLDAVVYMLRAGARPDIHRDIYGDSPIDLNPRIFATERVADHLERFLPGTFEYIHYCILRTLQ